MNNGFLIAIKKLAEPQSRESKKSFKSDEIDQFYRIGFELIKPLIFASNRSPFYWQYNQRSHLPVGPKLCLTFCIQHSDGSIAGSIALFTCPTNLNNDIILSLKYFLKLIIIHLWWHLPWCWLLYNSVPIHQTTARRKLSFQLINGVLYANTNAPFLSIEYFIYATSWEYSVKIEWKSPWKLSKWN